MQVADEQMVFSMLNEVVLHHAMATHKPVFVVPEIEAICTKVLLKVELQGQTVIPSARAANLTMNRDRIRQEATELRERTARYAYAQSAAELLAQAQAIGFTVAIKSVMTTSGKGQSVVHTEADVSNSWGFACACMRGDRKKVIVEEFIHLKHEITLLTVRQQHGPTLFCPPIGHVQERGDYQNSWQP